MGEAGPSTLPVGKHGTSTVFVRALGSKKLHCVLVDEGMSMLALWEQHLHFVNGNEISEAVIAVSRCELVS